MQIYFTDPTQISSSSSQSDQLEIVFNGAEQYLKCKSVIEVDATATVNGRRRLSNSLHISKFQATDVTVSANEEDEISGSSSTY
jgi:hypothetical protein